MDIQDTIQELINQFVAEGKEDGAQVAVYLDGKLVVDAFAGVTDPRTGTQVDGDSLFPIFSTTKGIFSTVIHILAERGLIDYDMPIAKYWPEFAANGKETITMRHAMSHTSGIPYMPENVTLEQLADWDYMCAQVAQLRPHSAAGAKQQYHPITFGWILGEVARRVDGRTVPQLLADEICRPLGITRLFCGIPAEIEPQTVPVVMVPDPPVVIGPPPHDCPPCAMPLHHWINWPLSRIAPQPGANGIASARAIARTYAATLPGGVDGVQLISPERFRVATEEQAPTDGYEAGQQQKALGYQLGPGNADMGDSATAFGHGGYGGSQGYADTKYRLAIGITRNRYSDHWMTGPIVHEIYRHAKAAMNA